MASPEQTEKATPKRVSEARNGQVARSPDVSGSTDLSSRSSSRLHLTFISVFHSRSTRLRSRSSRHGNEPVNIHSVWGLFARSFAAVRALLGFDVPRGARSSRSSPTCCSSAFCSHRRSSRRSSACSIRSRASSDFSSRPQAFIQLAKQLAKIRVVFVIVFMQLHDQVPMFFTLAHAAPATLMMRSRG